MYGMDVDEIYGIALFWKEAAYNFAHWDKQADLDWDNTFYELLRKCQSEKEISYPLQMAEFASLLNDGHTYVSLPNTQLELPIEVENLENRHIIVNTREGCPIPCFDEVLQIEGQSVDQFMETYVFPYCWHGHRKGAYRLLYCLQDAHNNNAYGMIAQVWHKHTLQVQTTSGIYELDVQRKGKWPSTQRLHIQESWKEEETFKGGEYHLSEDDIAVFTISSFLEDTLPEYFYTKMQQIPTCKGIVFDVRDNCGGHSANGDEIAKAFFKEDVITAKVEHPIHIGAYQAWGKGRSKDAFSEAPVEQRISQMMQHRLCETEWEICKASEQPFYLNQPVVILINEGTASSAENFVLNLSARNRATLIGSATYGSTGNVLKVELPKGLCARICTRAYYKADGSAWINQGITPHLFASLSLKDRMEKRDSVMETGLQYLRNQMR